jgi:glycoside/pentoside/hexuronide:cation symporter, GPH family
MRPLARWQVILYASGSLSVALSYQAFATYIQFLYIDRFGLRALSVGVVWSIYGLWNAINDPLAGYLSDRTRTRWGRRIPWIAGLFLPLSATFYLLWTPSEGLLAGPEDVLLAYFLVIVLAFDLLWTIVVMNWTALFPEMVPGEQERATVSAWRQIFSVVGLMIGVALPPVLAGADWSGRERMALLLATVTALFFALSLLGSRERPRPAGEPTLPLRAALQTAFRHRDFRAFLGANLALQFILLMLVAVVPFYTKYVLRLQAPLNIAGMAIDVELQNSLFLGITFLITLPALPLWAWLSRRWGAWLALRRACLFSALTLSLFFLPRGFYDGLLAASLFGVVLAGLLMLPDLLIAALVDADELATGARREGLYFGLNGLVIRFAFTFQGLLVGLVLNATGYVNSSAEVLYPAQPAAAIWGIRLLIGGVPAVAALIAYLFLGYYRLHGARLAIVKAAVAERHAGTLSPDHV